MTEEDPAQTNNPTNSCVQQHSTLVNIIVMKLKSIRKKYTKKKI